MAFNEQNREDAYKFFVLTFNAVPGAKHAVDVVNAYNAGLTTAEIIEIYTSKDAFKAIYADSLTSKEFAEKLVANVAAASTSVAAKTAAVNDIVKAMEGGMTKGGVIYQVLGNLSNKPVTDLDWGTTVAKLNNKVEVAKALTEGAKALQATDVATLQAAIAGVTEDAATIQQALDKSSVLASKLETLAKAVKDKATFAAALDLNADGKVDGLTASDVSAKVTTDLEEKVKALSTVLTTGKESLAVIDAAIAQEKASLSSSTATKKTDVIKAEADALAGVTSGAVVAANAITSAQLAQYKALGSAVKNAADAQLLTFANQAAAVTKLASLGATTTPSVKYTVPLSAAGDQIVTGVTAVGAVAYDAVAKQYKPSETQLQAINGLDSSIKQAVLDLISAANANINAIQNIKAAADALNKEFTAVSYTIASADDGATTPAPLNNGQLKPVEAVVSSTDAVKAAQANNAIAVINAEKLLADAIKAESAYLSKIAAYQAAQANKSKVDSLDKALADAQKSFTDAGLAIPKEAKTGLVVATGEVDTFLPSDATSTIASFGAVGKDAIYVGANYAKGADLTKGDDSKLEVFFKANGADTDVYVEQKVFGSNVNGAAAGNKDIFKITLTGVAADKLVLSNDGFITLA